MGLSFVRALLVLPQVLWAQEVQGPEPDPFSSGPDPFAEGEGGHSSWAGGSENGNFVSARGGF